MLVNYFFEEAILFRSLLHPKSHDFALPLLIICLTDNQSCGIMVSLLTWGIIG